MNIKHIIVAFSMLLVSCNTFLEKEPNSQYSIEIDDLSKIQALITSAYPEASYFPFLEAQTDNVSEREGNVYSNRLNESMYFWQENNSEDPDTPLYYWNTCYRGIAEVNHALQALKKFPQKTPHIKALYGEALVLRAYLHFMIANIWAKPFDPNTADADLGIPYLTHPEKNALPHYDRSTLAQTYEKIKQDLEIGLGLIDDTFYSKPKFHFNKMAAYAFATRFYLYVGDWDKVILLSEHILGVNPASRIKDWSVFSYNKNYNPNARVLDLYQVDHPSNLLVVSVQSRWSRKYKTEKYGLDFKTSRDLFSNLSPPNLDISFYYNNQLLGRERSTAKYIEKFQDYATLESEDNDYRGVYTTNILFSVDEVYLNRIEALIMKQELTKASLEIREYAKAKFSHAITHTEILYSFPKGQDTYYSAFGSLTFFQGSMLALVGELRRREFVHEGLRWFDIRRFHLLVDRNQKNGSFLLEHILKKDDPRKVMQIPNSAINQGIMPNPR